MNEKKQGIIAAGSSRDGHDAYDQAVTEGMIDPRIISLRRFLAMVGGIFHHDRRHWGEEEGEETYRDAVAASKPFRDRK